MIILLFLVGFISVECAYTEDSTTVRSCDDVAVPEAQIFSNNTLCPMGPCIVHPGTNLSMTIKFKAPRYLEHIKTKIIASAAGVQFEYPLPEDDACEGISNTYCPLVKDEPIEYTYVMYILTIFPEAAVTLQISMTDLDDDAKDFVCFIIDIQVKKS